MTKRHFEAIAAMIRERLATLTTPCVHGAERCGCVPAFAAIDRMDELETIAENLALLCYQQNPRFSRTRFLKACGLNTGA